MCITGKLEALQVLIDHPTHIQAKQRQSRWLNGYQIVIAEVIGSYGDGRIQHPLAGRVPMRPKATGPTSLGTSPPEQPQG